MKITRTSPFSGTINTREIAGVTIDKLQQWKMGAKIQDVFPELSADDREFIITGITPEEFPKGDD